MWGGNARATFAGRTDAGVHAAGQVVSLPDCRPDLAPERVRQAINARLPSDVAVVAAKRGASGFDARRDAIWRSYRYRIWIGPRQPLVDGLIAQRSRRLAITAMAEGASLLVGRHDFAAFAGSGKGVPGAEHAWPVHGTVREVYAAEVVEVEPWWGPAIDSGTLIEVRLVANGYLPQMVRTVAGTLIDIGRGMRPPTWISDLLRIRDRRDAGATAPPEGLTLWRVGYPGDKPDEQSTIAAQSDESRGKAREIGNRGATNVFAEAG
jgi:tRNA pseudouridine38-40 synthase